MEHHDYGNLLIQQVALLRASFPGEVPIDEAVRNGIVPPVNT